MILQKNIQPEQKSLQIIHTFARYNKKYIYETIKLYTNVNTIRLPFIRTEKWNIQRRTHFNSDISIYMTL